MTRVLSRSSFVAVQVYLVMITSSRLKSRDRANAAAIDDAEKNGKSMKMVMRVQNSGVINATLLQNVQTEASANGFHSEKLQFLKVSKDDHEQLYRFKPKNVEKAQAAAPAASRVSAGIESATSELDNWTANIQEGRNFDRGYSNHRGNLFSSIHLRTYDALNTPVCLAGNSSNTSEGASRTSLSSSSVETVDSSRKASIASLPVELLAIIFGEVHRSCMLEGSKESKCSWNPSTLALVCPTWEVAVSLTPEFWTHIDIFFDAPHFSAAFVTSIFVRSHNLIIEKATLSRSIWTSTNDEHERERVMMAMQAIAPHMHRCRAIIFVVRFSSSLPSFPHDFHGNAKLLTCLKLKCVEDDGCTPSSGEIGILPDHREPFQCPNLRILSIDGRNYFNACQQNVNWTDMFPLVFSISISHFTPVAIRSESFTTSALRLSLLPFRDRLAFCSINDVHLDESPIPLSPNPFDSDNSDELDDNELNDNLGFNRLQTIALRCVHNTQCVRQILEILGESPNLHISRCRFDSWPEWFNCRDYLTLRKIDRGEDIVAFLKDCDVNKLVIDDCLGFSDDVLNAMIVSTPRTLTYPHRASDYVRYLKDFSIHNCSDFPFRL